MRYLLTALAVAGCTSAAEPAVATFERGDDRLVVTTDRKTYRAGDTIQLSIRNVSTSALGISLCPGTWEQRDGETWLRSEQLMICSGEYTTLPAGATLNEFLLVPEGLAGEQRVIVHLAPSRGDMPEGTASNGFVVE